MCESERRGRGRRNPAAVHRTNTVETIRLNLSFIPVSAFRTCFYDTHFCQYDNLQHKSLPLFTWFMYKPLTEPQPAENIRNLKKQPDLFSWSVTNRSLGLKVLKLSFKQIKEHVNEILNSRKDLLTSVSSSCWCKQTPSLWVCVCFYSVFCVFVLSVAALLCFYKPHRSNSYMQTWFNITALQLKQNKHDAVFPSEPITTDFTETCFWSMLGSFTNT